MNSIKNISKIAKSFISLALITIVALMPATTSFAWGGNNLNNTPGGTNKVCVRDQETSTAENCEEYIHPAASYALFNRFIDRPDGVGNTIDERNFVLICEIDPVTDYCSNSSIDHINVLSGKQYQVVISYHNNGATLGNGNPNPLYSSVNAKIKVTVPDSLSANVQKDISSTISWDTPGQPGKTSSVWDEAYIKSVKDVNIRYVSGSAKIHMNEMDASYNQTGIVEKVMPTSLFSSGALIGHFDTSQQEIVLDGVVNGCAKYSGYVTFRFEIEVKPCPTNPNLEIDDPGCSKPCPTNPNLPADDPGCVEPCPTDPNLAKDDPKCVGVPDTGSFTRNILPIIIIGACVAFVCVVMTRKSKFNHKD